LAFLQFLLEALLIVATLVAVGGLCYLAWRLLDGVLKACGVPARRVWGDRAMVGLTVVGIGLAVAGFVWLAQVRPNQAQTRVWLSKVFGYPATRITVNVEGLGAATRRALVDELTPMMRAQRARFRYRIVSSRMHTRTTVRADLPSRYRLGRTRLEIVTGRPIDPEKQRALGQVLHAAGQPSAPALPEPLWADVRQGQAPVLEAALLPHTATLRVDDVVGPAGYERQQRCALQVQGLVSVDVLDAHGGPLRPLPTDADTRLVLRTRPHGLRQTRLRVLDMTYVPGEHGRLIKTAPHDSWRIYMAFSLVPEGVSPDGDDCDARLLDALDPAWVQADLRHQQPALSQAKGVRVAPVARFLPWQAGDGWVEVPARP